jgi:hypothetical protein
MRKLLLILGLVLSAMAAAPVGAQAAPVLAQSLCGTTCGTFQTWNGAGQQRASATGTAYGSIGRGTIVLLDRSADGVRGWSVAGYDRSVRLKDGWWKFTGVDMTFSTKKSWSFKILKARGINVRIVASGSTYIQGSGRYSINSSNWRTWPALGRRYFL